MHRKPLFREPVFRAMGVRSPVCSGGACVPAVTVPLLVVPNVALPGESVPSGFLPMRSRREGVDAAEGQTSATYAARDTVLFEYNRHELLPGAAAVLDAILADAGAKGFHGLVRVEGHTDDTGTTVGNQRLSELRARAVADHLVGRGVSAASVTVTGRGESTPAYPNDSDENRARNRRVVIEFGRG